MLTAPDFTGRAAIVVGGGAGLGRAVAIGLAAAGARVGVLGRRPQALDETLALLPAGGHPGHLALRADVTAHDELATAVATAAERLGDLHVAVNTAGVFVAPSTVADADLDAVADLVAVNVTGTYAAMRAELRIMRTAGRGVVVNFSSNIGAHQNRAGLAAYGASKAAVSAMTAAAAVDHARDGVRVVAISPGPSDTPMSRRPGETDDDRARRVATTHPLGRVATLDEVVAATLFLASDAASHLVGTDLVVDGGASAAVRSPAAEPPQ